MSKLILMWGLPASGKTTKALELAKNAGTYIDVDNIVMFRKYSPENCTLLESVVREISGEPSPIIIDSLLTLNESCDRLLSEITKARHFDEIEIWVFDEDREVLLKRDRDRVESGGRESTSENTIRNMPFEYPNSEIINKYKIKVVNMEKPTRDQILSIYGKKITSSSWCLGGTWGDCWGGKGTVSAEPPPASFAEFDDFLMEIFPEISFLQYKKIYNECVKITEEGYGDYYGGYKSYAHFQCDVERVCDILQSWGKI